MPSLVATLRPSFVMIVVLTALLGLAYPLAVTGVAQVLFPAQANGSLVKDKAGNVVGSELVGQPFDAPGRFWSRPSATGPTPYNGLSSSGSNQGPLNPALKDAVAGRVKSHHVEGVASADTVPVDLVTASGSGLDPHISPAAALYQVPRVAKERGVPEAELKALVEKHIEGRTLGLLGEPRVNVLALNLALDGLDGVKPAPGEKPLAPAPPAEAAPTAEATDGAESQPAAGSPAAK